MRALMGALLEDVRMAWQWGLGVKLDASTGGEGVREFARLLAIRYVR